MKTVCKCTERTMVVCVNKQCGINAANMCFWFGCALWKWTKAQREYAYPHIDLSEVNEQCKQTALIYDKTINVIGKKSLIFSAHTKHRLVMTHFILVLSSAKRSDDYYLFIFHTPACGSGVVHSLSISPLLWIGFSLYFGFVVNLFFGLRDSRTTIWS